MKPSTIIIGVLVIGGLALVAWLALSGTARAAGGSIGTGLASGAADALAGRGRYDNQNPDAVFTEAEVYG